MRSSLALLVGSILVVAWANAQAEEGEVPAAPTEASVAATGPAESVPAPEAEAADAAPAEVTEVEPQPELAAAAPPAAEGEPQPELAAVAPPAAEGMVDAPETVPAEEASGIGGSAAPKTVLGAIGYDAEGREGRVHIVVPGDTLWDISNAYLGTPWVWPSIWQDNREIANPHLIHPGDHIWITPSEMRRVTEQEAQALLAGSPAAPAPEASGEPEEETAPATPPIAAPEEPEPRVQRVSTREGVGLITAEEFESAASIVDAVTPRLMLSQGDVVYIGLGEGEVEKGDQFTIFRKEEKVRDPDSHNVLGYHVDILGWLEVQEVHGDTASASIELSVAEIERGDRLIERDPMPAEIAVLDPPIDVSGKVSFFARRRTLMGETDYVYLNRGSLDGLEVGSPLEIYREGREADEEARDQTVHTPDRVIAGLLVVRTQPETSVAFVTYSDEEIELGDQFRAESR